MYNNLYHRIGRDTTSDFISYNFTQEIREVVTPLVRWDTSRIILLHSVMTASTDGPDNVMKYETLSIKFIVQIYCD